MHTQTCTHTFTHTHSLVKSCVIILPGQISLCVETPRGLDTLCSSPQHSASSLLHPGCFICPSAEKKHRCVLERDAHTGSCVNRYGAVTMDCEVYLSFFPLPVSHFFIFLCFDSNNTVGLHDRKEGRLLSKITSNSAPTLVV